MTIIPVFRDYNQPQPAFAGIIDAIREHMTASSPQRAKPGREGSRTISDEARSKLSEAMTARNEERFASLRDDVMRLHATGLSGVEIARIVDRSPRTVRRVVRRAMDEGAVE